ncbi:MAG: efflux RND transporter permease subunit, partial [Pseudomonadota bacterium]|nr:efflux RND transporter permease subunit [Pseudomonadota bacterium]
VVVDPIRLASYGLSIDEVANVLSSLSLDIPAGSFKSNDQLLMVRADASVWRPEAVERLAIRNDIKLGDVGQAFYGPAEAESYSLLNGRKVVGIGIVRRAQSNTIAISEAVQEAVERLNRRMKDVELIVISDDAQFIRSSVREVVVSLSIAVLVVIGVIFVFVGALRSTLIPAIAIPIALSGTIAAIWLLGFSINILTLLALVLATGMIVDDAIVVIENIQRQRALGLKPFAASVIGTRQVFFAVLATTATLISVFLPIAFLPSTAGKLFTEFGFVLAVAVGISSFVALSLCPMLASRLPDFGDGDKRTCGLLSRLSALVTAGYQRLLVFTLNARFLVIGSAVVIASVAFAVFPTIDRELLPREDRGAIIIMMQGPDGVGLDYMDRQSARAEALLEPLREKGEITNILSIVGRWDLNRNYIIAPLAPWSERSRSQLEIAKALREPLKAIPGATARVRIPNSLNLRRAGGRVEFTLTGSNYRDIAAAADDFLDVLRERAPELDDLEIEFQQTQPQLSLTVDRRRTEDLGIPIEGIVNTLRAMVDGFEVAELNVEDRSVPVLLESTAGAIDDPSDLKNLFVRAANGTLA